MKSRDYIVKNFRSFSDKLADFAENAFNNRWIDAGPREGKGAGPSVQIYIQLKKAGYWLILTEASVILLLWPMNWGMLTMATALG